MAKPPERPVDELPFEAALQRLEAVVDRLEQGDLELEQSLEAFEEGVRLSKRCSSRLDAAEQRVEVLTREGGRWLARPFDGVPVPEDGEDREADSAEEEADSAEEEGDSAEEEGDSAEEEGD